MGDIKFSQVDFDPFSEGEILRTAPSTESQKEIWLSVQIGGDNANCAYNESVELTIEGAIDVDTMQKTLRAVVARHDALRTTLSTDGSKLSIVSEREYDFPFIDLSECDDFERNSKHEYILDQEVTVPFDLEHGPLFQTKIIKMKQSEFRLIITGHHIILDGWSIAVVLQDINDIYTALVTNKTLSMRAADSFSSYAITLAEQQNGTENRGNEDFWLEQFKDNVPVLDLPTSYTRPSKRTFKAESKTLLLDKSFVSSLKKFSAGAKTSLTVVLLAGFKILLHRLAGQEDIVVGLPAADQAVTGLHNLVGHCVNTLPLRSHISGDMTVIDVIKNVKSGMLNAYDHQRFTYGSLLKKLKVARDLSRIPLVSILFNIDPGMKALNIAGIKSTIKTNLRKFENFDMFLNGTELDGQVLLECLYSTDIFDSTSMKWRLDEYKTILLAMMAHQDYRINDINIIPQDEYNLQVFEWNKTERDYLNDLCLHDLFQAAVKKYPDSVAIEFNNQLITYHELNKRSDVFSNYMKSMGVHPGSLVGVYLERSVDMVVALLGILKAGGAYVPIDPEYPQERIGYMIDNAGVAIVVTQSNLDTFFINDSINLFYIDNMNFDSGNVDVPESWNPPAPDDLAYVIYTSGSTGKPKGVKVPHRSLVNFMLSMSMKPGMTNNDILLAVTTLSFDIAGLELYLPLVNGAKVHMVSRETATDGNSLLKTLETAKITMMQATPSTWRMMIEAGWDGSDNLKALCGGETLQVDLAEELIPRCKEVWNMYGPTETTIWSTCYHLIDPKGPILVGRPIANTQAYILDDRLRPVPVGVAGELYLGGYGVALGYMNLPEQTSKSFIPNPFIIPGQPNSLMYKTGDLCRYMPTGDLEHCGRIDHQVKVRGFRIELGEIENTLSSHAMIRQAICVVKEFSAGDSRIAAYIVPENSQRPDDVIIKDYLREKLPGYMIPQYFMDIDVLPLTPAGKIDRKKLQAELEIGSESSQVSYVACETPTEISVARIWEEVLKLETISKIDNFFNIGGHSLLAARVISRINREFDVVIKLGELFQRPTIEGLALKIDSMKGASNGDQPREIFEF